jgi:uncharacterized protein DUF1918
MRAHKGDTVVVPHPHTGSSARKGQIVEVKGEDGGPPFAVQWSDGTRAEAFVPGPEATIEPASQP